MKDGKDLDKIILKSSAFSKVARKVAVHAIGTARNLIERDVKLLEDALRGERPILSVDNAVLGIRICRMHWYRQHWLKVMERYRAQTNKQFVNVLKSKRGLFRDLMVALADG